MVAAQGWVAEHGWAAGLGSGAGQGGGGAWQDGSIGEASRQWQRRGSIRRACGGEKATLIGRQPGHSRGIWLWYVLTLMDQG
jgi:hypothetical protein